MHTTPEERFWTHVDKSGECWVWTAYRLPSGYGTVHVRPKRWLAHRLSWSFAHGPIPEGMEVCHRCDNPPCVRPDHLFLGTSTENKADMRAKGREAAGDRNGARKRPERLPHGEDHWATKLTEADVASIRRRYATKVATGRELAREYGVGPTAISHIVNWKVWRRVDVVVDGARSTEDIDIEEIRRGVYATHSRDVADVAFDAIIADLNRNAGRVYSRPNRILAGPPETATD